MSKPIQEIITGEGRLMHEDLAQRKKNLWFFPLGTVGRDMIYNLFTGYLMTYILITRQLSVAQLAAISIIMAAARVFDALNDPVMGNIIEHTRTRWGKFKPWLVIGILTTSFVIIYTFNNNYQGWTFVWFFAVMYFLYSITYTMHDIAYWGMVPALSSDPDARNMFTARATLFAGVGMVLAMGLIPTLTTDSNALGGNAVTAYGRRAVIVSILAPLFMCFTVFGVKEQRNYKDDDAPPISIKTIVKTISGNDQLVCAALVLLLRELGGGIIANGVGQFYVYFEYGYEGGLWFWFTMIGMSATAFLMIFYPAIARKHTRKSIMDTMMLISAIGYAFMLVIGILLPTSTIKFWLIVLGYTAGNFGSYCFYLILMISISNCVEYNEIKTGEREEAVIGSIRPFVTKLASALVALITSGIYIVFRVLESTNQISALENAAQSGTITADEKLGLINEVITGIDKSKPRALLICMTVLSLVFMYSAYRLYKKKYRLDEDEYKRICEELEERRAAV